MKIALLQPRKSEPLPEWGDVIGWYLNIINGLIVSDLRKAGHECDYILVFDFGKDEVIEKTLSELERYDYVIYYRGDIQRKKIKSLEDKVFDKADELITVTNPCFLSDSRVKYNILGSKRRPLRDFIRYLNGDIGIKDVPNLFYKRKGKLCHSGIFEEREQGNLFPYDPLLDFKVIGRSYSDEFHFVKIHGSPGCPYGKPNNVELNARKLIPTDLEMSKDAEEALERIMARRGCIFCQKKFNPINDVNKTRDLVIKQFRFWQEYFENHKIDNKRIQMEGESILFYLDEVYDEIDLKSFSNYLHSKVDFFLESKGKFEKALEIGRNKDIKIVMNCLGFESFSQKDLEIYNKGFEVEDNVRAIGYLRELKESFPESFEYKPKRHGFIMFNPWTDINSLKTNLRYIEKLGIYGLFNYPFLLTKLSVPKTSPLFFELEKKDLLKSTEDPSFESFEFLNKEIEEIWRTLKKLNKGVEELVNTDGLNSKNRWKTYNKTLGKGLKKIMENIEKGNNNVKPSEILEEVLKGLELDKW